MEWTFMRIVLSKQFKWFCREINKHVWNALYMFLCINYKVTTHIMRLHVRVSYSVTRTHCRCGWHNEDWCGIIVLLFYCFNGFFNCDTLFMAGPHLKKVCFTYFLTIAISTRSLCVYLLFQLDIYVEYYSWPYMHVSESFQHVHLQLMVYIN